MQKLLRKKNRNIFVGHPVITTEQSKTNFVALFLEDLLSCKWILLKIINAKLRTKFNPLTGTQLMSLFILIHNSCSYLLKQRNITYARKHYLHFRYVDPLVPYNFRSPIKVDCTNSDNYSPCLICSLIDQLTIITVL